jgi:osmotically inducible lipoprotein OsmB
MLRPSNKSDGGVTVVATLILGAAFLLAGCFVLTGCSGQPLSTREKGTLGGGVLGAGAGAIVGAAVGHPAAGAAIGGALGAGTGYVVGNSLQNQEVTSQQQQGQIQYQQREIQAPWTGGHYAARVSRL